MAVISIFLLVLCGCVTVWAQRQCGDFDSCSACVDAAAGCEWCYSADSTSGTCLSAGDSCPDDISVEFTSMCDCQKKSSCSDCVSDDDGSCTWCSKSGTKSSFCGPSSMDQGNLCSNTTDFADNCPSSANAASCDAGCIGGIIGAVVGGVCFLSCAAACVWFLCCRKKKKLRGPSPARPARLYGEEEEREGLINGTDQTDIASVSSADDVGYWTSDSVSRQRMPVVTGIPVPSAPPSDWMPAAPAAGSVDAPLDAPSLSHGGSVSLPRFRVTLEEDIESFDVDEWVRKAENFTGSTLRIISVRRGSVIIELEETSGEYAASALEGSSARALVEAGLDSISSVEHLQPGAAEPQLPDVTGTPQVLSEAGPNPDYLAYSASSPGATPQPVISGVISGGDGLDPDLPPIEDEDPFVSRGQDGKRPQLYCAIIFVLCAAAMIALGTDYWIRLRDKLQTKEGKLQEYQDYLSNASKTAGDAVSKFEDYEEIQILYFLTLLARAIGISVGVAFAEVFLWLLGLRFFARPLVKMSIIFAVLSSLIGAAFMTASPALPVGGFWLCIAVVRLLWTCFTWKRVKYVAEVISVSTRVIPEFPSMIGIALIASVLQIGWFVLTIGCIVDWGPTNMFDGWKGNVARFFSVFMLFWGTEVIGGVTHVIIADLTALWYFESRADQSMTPSERFYFFRKALGDAFLRIPGPICFGGFVVAAIRWLLYLLKKTKKTQNPCIKWLWLCLCVCQELLRLYNSVAFTVTAIYMCTYQHAAKRCKDIYFQESSRTLSMSLLLDACESLGGAASSVGSTTCGIICFWLQISLEIGNVSLKDWFTEWELWVFPLVAFVVGSFLGWAVLRIVGVLIEATATATLMCFTLNHDALRKTKPELWARLLHMYNHAERNKLCCGC